MSFAAYTNVPPGWVCTDPDTHQFRRDNPDGTFTFKQLTGSIEFESLDKFALAWVYMTHIWKQAIIDVSEYSRKEIRDMLLTFYKENQIPDVANIDNPEHHALIAECIFELGMYDE